MARKERGACARQLDALAECERKAVRALGPAQGRGACHKLHQAAAWCLISVNCPSEAEAVDSWQNAPRSSKQRYFFSEAMAELDACLEATSTPRAPEATPSPSKEEGPTMDS